MNANYRQQAELEDLVQALGAATDPLDRTRALRAIADAADAMQRQSIAQARADGATYAAIGEALGISAQAVHMRLTRSPVRNA